MGTIHKEIMIEAKPEQVWDAVRDVGAVHRRFVPGYTIDTQLDGDNRILTFANGAVVRELIVSLDDEARRLAYAVVEGPMPLKHHHASFQVIAESDSQSRLIWITDFLPDERAAEVRARVDRGAEVMKQTIEAEIKNG
jgi:ribosome-associated toxin RatA of RatAB toxin-antitoxin module